MHFIIAFKAHCYKTGILKIKLLPPFNEFFSVHYCRIFILIFCLVIMLIKKICSIFNWVSSFPKPFNADFCCRIVIIILNIIAAFLISFDLDIMIIIINLIRRSIFWILSCEKFILSFIYFLLKYTFNWLYIFKNVCFCNF